MPSKSKSSSSKKASSSRKKSANPLEPVFKKNPRSFRIGGSIMPKRDLGRFVRWPKYIRIQRQRKVLKERLKTPPAINQFSVTLDKNQATEAMKLFNKYRPESSKDKKERLRALGAKEAAAAGAGVSGTRGPVVHYGLNHVTTMVEQQRAKLVLIASDVDPIELVLWLPALCRRMGVPFAIIKNRSRLGALVHQKNATCVCLEKVNAEDNKAMDTLSALFMEMYNNNPVTSWGERTLGMKTTIRVAKREARRKAEAAARAAVM